MSKIKIETITAVHIGSGETLYNGNDFVVGVDSEGYDVVSVIDPRKVMELIGTEDVQSWVTSIERKESTGEVVERFSPKSTIEDYSKRILENCAEIKPTDTLKEFIHNGMGKPYIPGSSIKGAIRSAVLASLAQESKQPITNKNGSLSASMTESYYFGKDPNHDVFRFLQVGDAHFGENYEVVVKMVNLNERIRKGYWDESKPQLIEVLGEEDEATFNMSINQHLINATRGKVHAIPDCFSDLTTLFQTINAHTKNLLEDEIAYWANRQDDDSSDKTTLYIKRIKTILLKVESCTDGKSCILRVGHGSGWRFITGAWTENREDFYEVIVPRTRPKDKEMYSNYEFPKSRRVSTDCELLGFVKLTILDK